MAPLLPSWTGCLAIFSSALTFLEHDPLARPPSAEGFNGLRDHLVGPSPFNET